YIVKNLVDNPESVKIELFEGERSSVVEVHVAEADIAKVVGRQGRTIKALRTVAMTLGSRYDKRVRLELVD
ncbi:MAG: KH domain-containing protein, partial [Simkaniaceae bacterium]|nr:KH domain-containing protein [Simkaniaceae bacterium]